MASGLADMLSHYLGAPPAAELVRAPGWGGSAACGRGGWGPWGLGAAASELAGRGGLHFGAPPHYAPSAPLRPTHSPTLPPPRPARPPSTHPQAFLCLAFLSEGTLLGFHLKGPAMEVVAHLILVLQIFATGAAWGGGGVGTVV